MLKAIVKTEKSYEVYTDQCMTPDTFDLCEDWESVCSSIKSKGIKLTYADIHMIRHAISKEDQE